MSRLITLRRTATPGKIPSTADMQLGELAINTYDGKVYLKKNVNGAETIVTLGEGATTSGSQGAQGATGPSGGPGTIGAQGSTGNPGPQGTVGPQGNQGPLGFQGNQGPTGPQGLQGIMGPQGNQGPTGLQGAKGDQGFQGLKGDKGDQGFNGITGSQGDLGHQGNQGPIGFQGNQGPTGLQGTTGQQGNQGPTGFQGNQGPLGPQGNTGAQGNQGPTGFQGNQGPLGFQGAKGDQGNQGPTGLQGTAGTNGSNGAQGNQGPTGLQGTAGTNGSNGAQGNQGPTGLQGSTGPQGTKGDQGPTGLQGIAGTNGSNGAQGNQGPTGLQGTNGTNGAQGNQGPTGIQGTAGSNGAQGNQGPTGLQGTVGTTGFQGNQGPTGLQGTAGTNGTNGSNGAQGNQGPTGLQGTAGSNGGTGAQGNQGPTGLQGTTGAASTVAGPQGNTGAASTVAGPQGLTGPQGNTGPQGAKGDQGLTGPQGNTGPQGAKGDQGNTGPQGLTGPQGNTGPQGIAGPQGNTGAASTVAGPQGNTGAASTVAGPQGAKGDQGFTGPQGGTAGTAQNLYGPGGSYIQRSTSGTSYSNAYQIRETNGYSGNTSIDGAPLLGFHWGGVVASSIRMNAGGEIQVVNNPGTSYENFRANYIYNARNYIVGSTNNAYLSSSDWGMRMVNDNGYIQFGPANNSWAHIYSDKSFYFNQELYINGNRVYSDGYRPYADSAGSVSGLTINSSAAPINPDSVTQNQIGYNTSVSLFGQTDGGLHSSAYSSNWIHQIYGDFRTGQIAIRGKNSGTWQGWRSVLDSSNYNSWAMSGPGYSANQNLNTNSSVTFSTVNANNGYSFVSQAYNNNGGFAMNNASTYWGLMWNYSANDWRLGYGGTTSQVGWNLRWDNGGTVWANASMRAPIFYDSDDTTYYCDPNSNSKLLSLNIGYTGGTTYNTSSTGRIYFNNHGEGDSDGYSIGTTMNSSNGYNYSKLDISWHTGIRIGAAWNYGGIRFFNNSPAYYSGTQVFSIAEGDSNVRVTNTLYVGGDISVNNRVTLSTYNSNNLQVKGTSGGDSGIAGYGASGQLGFQLYGDGGGNYGFLWGTWGSWDLRKTQSGALYMNNNSTYYLRTNGASYVYSMEVATSMTAPDGFHATANWFRAYGDNGLYTQDYGGHFRRSVSASHGTWEMYGYNKGGYAGLNVIDPQGNWNNIMFESGNGGIYQQNGDGWLWYWSRGNSCLGIGSSSTSSGYKLRVNGATYSTGIIYSESYIQAAGAGYFGGDVTAYYSDARLKENIKPIKGVIEKLNKIGGYTYTANQLAIDLGAAETKEQRLGVIAQEVKEMFPEVIAPAPFDRNPLTGQSISGENYMTVKYERLVPVLIEAIKELNVKIVHLEAQLASK